MKKAYCTPVMEISQLETEDIVCASTQIDNLNIDIGQTIPTSPETPPVDFSKIMIQ